MDFIFANFGVLILIMVAISAIHSKYIESIKTTKAKDGNKNISSFDKMPKNKEIKKDQNVFGKEDNERNYFTGRKDLGERQVTGSRESVSNRKSMDNRYVSSNEQDVFNTKSSDRENYDLIKKDTERKDKETQARQDREREDRYKLDYSHNKEFKSRSEIIEKKKNKGTYSRHSYIKEMGNEFIDYGDQFIDSADKYLEYKPGGLYSSDQEV